MKYVSLNTLTVRATPREGGYDLSVGTLATSYQGRKGEHTPATPGGPNARGSVAKDLSSLLTRAYDASRKSLPKSPIPLIKGEQLVTQNYFLRQKNWDIKFDTVYGPGSGPGVGK